MKNTAEKFYKIYDNVLSDRRLSYPEKILYGVIVRLAMNGEKRCFASNKALAEIMGCSKAAIGKWLDKLEQNGYIKRRLHYQTGMKNVDKRYITPVTTYTTDVGEGSHARSTGYTTAVGEGIPRAYEDSKINIVKEFSKSEGSKRRSPVSSNFFLNLAANADADDIF